MTMQRSEMHLFEEAIIEKAHTALHLERVCATHVHRHLHWQQAPPAHQEEEIIRYDGSGLPRGEPTLGEKGWVEGLPVDGEDGSRGSMERCTEVIDDLER